MLYVGEMDKTSTLIKRLFNPPKLADQSGRIGSSIIHPIRPEGPQCVVTKISTSIQSSNTSYLTKEGLII
jgi:hypothetical protein